MPSKYTTFSGKASICQWELKFSFKLREQVVEFIKLLLEEDIHHTFTTYDELLETSTIYVVEIECSWANNLTRIGTLLEKVDYSMD